MIEVFRFHNGGSTEYYYLRSELDWDLITSFLDLDAERPKEPMVRDLQIYVHFDVGEIDDPMVAVRHYFRAWDTETGEPLYLSKNSDPASCLFGLSPTQAQLIFDMPVSETTVWMKDWDSDIQTMVPIKLEDGRYFLPLENYSAHYQVDVLYEPYDGICYEGTYVFDVEYQD